MFLHNDFDWLKIILYFCEILVKYILFDLF